MLGLPRRTLVPCFQSMLKNTAMSNAAKFNLNIRKFQCIVLLILCFLYNTSGTNSPTRLPSLLPSVIPTVLPTRMPTVLPTTIAPSILPTLIPTSKPTVKPSILPSALPSTAAPSVVPTTTKPTVVPTTFTPSYSMVPSLKPTTIAPTVLPSAAPSYAPVSAPLRYSISAYAGVFGVTGSSADGGQAAASRLKNPMQVWYSSTSNLYIADSTDSKVRRVDSSNILWTFAGGLVYGGDGFAASATTLSSPNGVWGDSLGNVYIAERDIEQGSIVRKVDSASSTIVTVAGYYSAMPLEDGNGFPATSAHFTLVFTIFGDSVGDFYTVDYTMCNIRRVDASGITSAVAGIAGFCNEFGNSGPATTAGLNGPMSGYCDSLGNIYIASGGNCNVRKVDTQQLISTIFGVDNDHYYFNGDGIAGTSTYLGTLNGVFTDYNGNLFITDTYQIRVRMLSENGLSYTIAGNGLASTSGDGGYATAATFKEIRYIHGSSSGNSLFVSDGDSVVRKLINLTPTVSPTPTPTAIPSSQPVNAPVTYIVQSFIGTGNSGGNGDSGAATSAKVAQPGKLWFNTAGVSYLADFSNNKVRMVSLGIIYTAIGNGEGATGGDGGAAGSASVYGPSAVWTDSQGQLYLTESMGAKVRFVSYNIITSVAGSGATSSSSTATNGDQGPATAATLNNPVDIMGYTPSGKVYVCDAGNNRIRVIASGIMTTVVGTGSATSSPNGMKASSTSLNYPAGIFIDSTGAGYFSEASGHVIRSIDFGTTLVSGVVGTFNSGYNGDGQAGTSTLVMGPRGLWGDTSGRLFFTDYNWPTLRMLSGGVVYTVAGVSTVASRSSGDGGAATAATFIALTYVTGDSQGVLYVSDSGANQVRKLLSINPTTSPTLSPTAGPTPTSVPSLAPSFATLASPIVYSIAAFSGIDSVSLHGGDGGKASSATFVYPYGVWQNTLTDVFINDYGSNRVRKVTGSTGIINTFAGTGGSTSTGDGFTATSASINRPIAAWADSLVGTVYISDHGGLRVRVVSGGIINTYAGNGGSGPATNPNGEGGQATAATVKEVYNLYGDSIGNLYLADKGYNKIRKIATNTGILTLIAGMGTASSTGDGGAASQATISNPMSVFVGTDGSLYCAEQYYKVRKVAVDGIISTYVGTSTNGYNGDGMKGSATKLNGPYGVYADSVGNLYVVDLTNRRVRVVDATTNLVYTVAGTGTQSSTGNNGFATSATFNSPVFIHGDTVGNMLLSDYNQPVVRKLFNMSPTVSPTPAPTVNPTRMPTALPTVVPTPAPTVIPSVTPSLLPTVLPSIGPSVLPTVVPTTSPSVVPTVIPSLSPTTMTPTAIPTTAMPTVLPVAAPYLYSISSVAGQVNIANYFGDGGPATASKMSSPHGIWKDTAGVYYIADYNNMRIRSLSNGIMNTFAGNGNPSTSGDGGAATSASINDPAAGWCSTLGSVYILERFGFKVRVVSTSGIMTTSVGNGAYGTTGDNGPATAATLNYPFGMCGDSAGNLFIADTAAYRVRKVSSGGIISAFAGTGGTSSGADGGPATSTSLSIARSVYSDSVGSLYVTEMNKIRAVVAGSSLLTTLAGLSSAGFNGDGLPGTSTALSSPWGLGGDTVGNVWISDYGNYRIRLVTAATNLVFTVAGNANSGTSGDGGFATAATLSQPCYLYCDSTGSVLIADCGAHIIRKLSPLVPSAAPSTSPQPSIVPTVTPTVAPTAIPTTPTVTPSIAPSSRMPSTMPVAAPSVYLMTTLAGSGTFGFSGDGGAMTASKIKLPYGIWKDYAGVTYFADYGNFRVRSISSSGIINTFAGNGLQTSSGDGGQPTAASINGPSFVWTDTVGSVFILERLNSRVRVVSVYGSISLYAGNGNGGFAGDNGPATAASINNPYGMMGDSAGALYIVDSANYRIRKISALGIIAAFAGTGNFGSTGDGGAATSASFSNPRALYLDTIGNFYISEQYKIRMISAGTSMVSTFGGVSSGGFNGDGLPATATMFSIPWGVCGDSAGNLWIADSDNYRIRMTTAVSNIVFTMAGSATPGSSGDGVLATSATFIQPSYLFPDSSGNVQVTDYGASVIRKLTLLSPTVAPTTSSAPSLVPSRSPSAQPVVPAPYGIAAYAGSTSPISSGDGGYATSAGINRPHQVWANSLGEVYIAELSGNKIRKVTSGIITTVAGNGGGGTTGNGGAATAANLYNPGGVWANSGGVVFLSEYTGATVRSVDVGGIINAYGGSGFTSSSSTDANGDGGRSTAATFHTPLSLFGDTNGNLFVVDSINYKVRMITVGGIISTIAGNGIPSTAGNGGPATSAALNYPYGVFYDTAYNYYVIEYWSSKLRMITGSTSIITLKAGNAGGSYNGEGLAATSTSFNSPYGIWGDSTGVLVVSDSSNQRIRAITVNSNLVYTIAGSGGDGISSTGNGGAATAATMKQPLFSAGDSVGNIFVSDYEAYEVRRLSGVTLSPTPYPTLSLSPTVSPTIAPSITPSVAPTVKPSVTPTQNPSLSPNAPSGSLTPTVAPSVIPTAPSGSQLPTVAPTVIPTAPSGSQLPTVAPTVIPTAPSGSQYPTVAPTVIPTAPSGSQYPTVAPSVIPTTPSGSQLPTVIPTLTPSVLPSVMPSVAPSSMPQLPTVTPTSAMPSSPPVTSPVSFLVNLYAGTTNFPYYSGDGGKATSAAFNNPFAIFYSSSGVLYVSDYYNNRVRKVDTSGIISTFVGTGASATSGDGGAASAAEIRVPSGVWGNSVGVTYVVERSGYKIRYVATDGIINTVVGNGSSGFTGDGGQATAASFSAAYDVVGDTAGNIYFSDSSNSRIRKVTPSGIITIAVGTSSGGSSAEGAQATSAAIGTMTGVFVSAQNSLYFTDAYHKVRYVVSGGSTVTTKAGTGLAGFNGDGLPATSTSLSDPYDVWISSSGAVYVTDSSNSRIRLVTSQNIVFTVCGNGVSASTGNAGPATAASILQAYFLAGDTLGNLFFSEYSGQDVRSLANLSPTVLPTAAPTVVPSTVFPTSFPVAAPYSYTIAAYAGKSGTSASTGDGGAATAATIDHPFGVWMNTAGVLYICDYNGNRIRAVSASGIMTTVVGNGAASSLGDNGPATSASINVPSGVWTSSLGNMFLTERSGHKIRVVASAGSISTFAGTGTASTSSTANNGDGGSRTAATLNTPYTLFGDSTATMYIADTFNIRVRKTTSGIISTIAGTGGSGGLGNGIEATSAALGVITGLFYNYAYKLYVVDYGYNKVRIMLNGESTISTKAGYGDAGFTGDGIAASSATLNGPLGLFGDTIGGLFITDGNNYRVRFVNGNTIYTVAGTGVSVSSGNDGPASAATFKNPWYVTGDSLGSLYVSDYSGPDVRKLSSVNPTVSPSAVPTNSVFPTVRPSIVPSPVPSTATPSVVPSLSPSGVPSFQPVTAPIYYVVSNFMGLTNNYGDTGDGGYASAAQLIAPYGLWMSTTSYLYVADPGSSKVKYVDSSGIVGRLLGNGEVIDGGDGGKATSAGANGPMGVWGDTVGRFYVVEADGSRVRVIDASGIVNNFAGTESASASGTSLNGDNGKASAASLNSPYHVTGDSIGNVYISDTYNNKVRMVNSNAIIKTIAGTGSPGTTGPEGMATSVVVSYPTCVFVDVSGNVIILSLGSQNIRVMGSSYSFLQWYAGNPSGFAGDGDAATSTYFSNPYGFWQNAYGVSYVADTGHHKLRMIDSEEGLVYTIAGNGGSDSSGNGGPGTSASFMNLMYIAGDVNGRLFVSDYQAADVRAVLPLIPSLMPTAMPVSAPVGYQVSTFAGIAFNTGITGDSGHASSAYLMNPYGVWCATIGIAYIADNGANSIRKVNSAGTISTFMGGSYGFGGNGGPATSAQLRHPVGVFGDKTGVIYVAEYTANRVRKIDANQIVSTLAGSTVGSDLGTDVNGDGGAATAATFAAPNFGFADTNGIVYIADTFNCKIRMVFSGIISTVIGVGDAASFGDNGAASAAGIGFPMGLFQDSTGTLYLADNGNTFLRRVSVAGIITTVAGNGNIGYNGDGLPGTSTSINKFYSVWGDSSGQLFFNDVYNYRVRMLTASNIVYTIAGNSVGGYTSSDGPATSSSFAQPAYIGRDTVGNLYVSDFTASIVRKLTSISPTASPTVVPTTALPSISPTIAPSVAPTSQPVLAPSAFSIAAYAGISTSGVLSEDVPATAASMSQPYGIWQNTNGILYIALYGSNKVRVVNSAQFISTYAGSGSPSSSGNGGPASSASLFNPMGVHGDANGYVYIVENSGHTIRLVDSTRTIIAYAGTGSASTVATASNGDSGAATAATFKGPVSVYVASSAFLLYVVDSGNYKIRAISTLTGVITTFAGTGGYGYSGDGGAATSATFTALQGIFVDSSLYVGDYDANRVRKIPSSKIVSTVVGSGLQSFNGDGQAATSTGVLNPRGVWRTTAGVMYFADSGLKRVRMSTSGGIVYTVAGIGLTGSTGDGGMATSASLNQPHGVFVATTGNLYLSDQAANVVRQLTLLVPTVSPSAVPSVSPSVPPSITPSVTPSIVPSRIPTVGPSLMPTVAPSVQPSAAPSVKVPTYFMTAFAGTGSAAMSVEGVKATSSQLSTSFSLWQNTLGVTYIAVYSSDRVRYVDTSGYIYNFAGVGQAGSTGDGGAASSAKINIATGVWGDTLGNVFLAEYSGQCGRIVNPSKIINTYWGTGTAGGSPTAANGDGGAATSATVNHVRGIRGDTSGTLYLADTDLYKIRSIDSSAIIRTVLGTGGSTFNGNGLPGTSTSLCFPKDVHADTSGNIYVTVSKCHLILKVNPKTAGSTVSTVAGTGVLGVSLVASAATSSPLNGPIGVWQDTNAVLYLSDGSNYLVKAINNNIISVISGTGTNGSLGDSGPALSGTWQLPAYLTGDTQGNLFISDYRISEVRKLIPAADPTAAPTLLPTVVPSRSPTISPTVPSGSQYPTVAPTVTPTVPSGSQYPTVAPSVVPTVPSGSQYPTVAPTVTPTVPSGSQYPTVAPTVVPTVPSGSQYPTVAPSAVPSVPTGSDSPTEVPYDPRQEVFTSLPTSPPVLAPSTFIVTQFAGQNISGDAGDNGPATSALLRQPQGVWMNSVGVFYVADATSNRVRKIDSSGIITTFAGSDDVPGTSDGDVGAAASSANLNCPSNVWGNNLGYVFIVESCTPHIRVVFTIYHNDYIYNYAGNGEDGHSGDGGPCSAARFSYPISMTGDTNNNYYVVDMGNHAIRMISSNIVSSLVGTGIADSLGDGGAATAASLNTPLGVYFSDSTGVLFVTEATKVRTVDTLSIIATLAGKSDAGYNGDGQAATSTLLSTPTGVTGSLNGDLVFSDSGNCRIRLIVSSVNIVYTIAGSGEFGFSGNDGPATAAAFSIPSYVTVATTGDIMISDERASNVRRLHLVVLPSVVPTLRPNNVPTVIPTTRIPTVIPSKLPTALPSRTPTLTPASRNPTTSPSKVPTIVPILSPSVVPTFTVTSLPSWDPTVLPTTLPTINPTAHPTCPTVVPTTAAPSVSRKPSVIPSRTPTAPTAAPTVAVAPTTFSIDTYAGVYQASYANTASNIAATSATMTSPLGVWADTIGNLYVADSSNFRVRKIDTDGIITTVIGLLNNLSSGDGNKATTASTKQPYGVWGDSAGKLFLVEYGSHLVRVISAAGIVNRLAGSGTAVSNPSGANGDGGPATAGTFYYPQGIWGDSVGNTYVADTNNNKIRKINSASIISTVAGSGGQASSADGLRATSAAITTPKAVLVDTLGSLYFQDVGGLKIRQVEAGSTLLTTFAGTGQTTFNADGLPATATNIYYPFGICFNTIGDFYIAEYAGSRIRMVTGSSLIVYTVAGTGIAGSSGDGGMATDATLQIPTYVTVDSSGNVYVSHGAYNIVRVLAPVAYPGRTFAPSNQATVLPTLMPTDTAAPSYTPLPSLAPTTSTPLLSVTSSPSVVPSAGPTVFKGSAPTSEPNCDPTALPTDQPSMVPTTIPSVPSQTSPPSINPTFTPVALTSSAPVLPSVVPSLLPFVQPSTVPTLTPSVTPSLAPTFIPSAVPSTLPSKVPTTFPSVHPSVSPSSASPSIAPTDIPLSHPTLVPFHIPTEEPSVAPTATSSKPTLGMDPGATLPSSGPISVITSNDNNPRLPRQFFKIVLPFSETVLQSTSNAFSDVDLTSGGMVGTTNYVMFGGPHLTSSVAVKDVVYGQVFSIDNAVGSDTRRRSVSLLQDFNNDGHTDLIIGDPTVSKCYVLFGSSDGLIDISVGFTIFGEQAADLTGWSVSDAGDVNNDTIHDIIIGAPNAKGVGAFYIIYGRSTGLSDVYLSELTSSKGFAMYGATRGDKIGVSVSGAGDVNKDGCDDVIVGGMMASQYNAGAAYVLFGAKIQSLSSVGSLTSDKGFKMVGESFSLSGYSVSGAGDVNKDGYDDVLVGTFPQKASFTSTSYLVYGSSSGHNLILNALISGQGMTLLGAGSVVTSVGDINHDGYDDVMVSDNLPANSGYLLFQNITFEALPSVFPSASPSLKKVSNAPSVKPTRNPSANPSVKPSCHPTTVSPSRSPSVKPTTPTVEPSVGVTAPTSRPSEEPTHPTVAPSEVPSTVPSEQPTESPSIEPTESPTVRPSHDPSLFPSARPSPKPTFAPTTVHPSVLIRPTKVPTFTPTAPSPAPSKANFTVVFVSTNANYQRSSVERINFVINATTNTNITGEGSTARFTILPSPNTMLTISFFNLSGDVIDFIAFPKLHSTDDLSIKKGSVIISLVNNQVVKLLNVDPTDMQPQHFDFAPFTPDPDDNAEDSTVLYVVLPGGFLVLAYLLYKLYNWRAEKAAINRTVRQVKEKLQLQAETIEMKQSEQFKALRKWHFERQERLLVVVFNEKLLSVSDYPTLEGLEAAEESSAQSNESSGNNVVIVKPFEDTARSDSCNSSDLNSLVDSVGSNDSALFDSPAGSPRNLHLPLHRSSEGEQLHQPIQSQITPKPARTVTFSVDVQSVSNSHSSSGLGGSSSSEHSGGSSIDNVDEDDDLRSVASDDWV